MTVKFDQFFDSSILEFSTFEKDRHGQMWERDAVDDNGDVLPMVVSTDGQARKYNTELARQAERSYRAFVINQIRRTYKSVDINVDGNPGYGFYKRDMTIDKSRNLWVPKGGWRRIDGFASASKPDWIPWRKKGRKKNETCIQCGNMYGMSFTDQTDGRRYFLSRFLHVTFSFIGNTMPDLAGGRIVSWLRSNLLEFVRDGFDGYPTGDNADLPDEVAMEVKSVFVPKSHLNLVA